MSAKRLDEMAIIESPRHSLAITFAARPDEVQIPDLQRCSSATTSKARLNEMLYIYFKMGDDDEHSQVWSSIYEFT